jgi:2-polyprenyl-3-methyl-5-hydroxy-6-metoxy-1,4-benzoquinol methylase
MDSRSHWENVYFTKAPQAVSWYRPHLEKSIEIIEKTAPDRSTSIIDIGGGESTLVDDLLARGYEDLTVLDISSTAIEVAQQRLGDAAKMVEWIAGDITNVNLPPQSYNFWHDRAVFHFLTTADQRSAYVRQVEKAVRSDGNLLISTFGPEGPTKCSGLEVVRYDADSLHREFGVRFRLLESFKEVHNTPFGTTQQFLYCLCRVD